MRVRRQLLKRCSSQKGARPRSTSFTFQQERHERQDGRLKFADGYAISTVVARRLDEAVELVEHFAQLSNASEQHNLVTLLIIHPP